MKKILMVLSIILLLTGCGNDDNPDKRDLEDNEYKVVFYNADNEILKEEIVLEGEDASAPNDPVKEGYDFAGWDTDYTDVKSDLDIYPFFTNQVTVNAFYLTLYVDGSIDEVYSVDQGAPLPNLEKLDLQKVFDGWYLDEAYSEPFNFTHMPNNDLTIYGRWLQPSTERTDELSYFISSTGNTNGNIHNGGYVVYDYDREQHIYALDNGIYSFDPSTMSHTLLYQTTSLPKYLTMNGDQLLYISSDTGYLNALDLTTNQVTVVLETETLLVAKYSNYIYVQMEEESYGSTYLMTKVLRADSLEMYSMQTSGAYNLNIEGSRLFYVSDNNIRLMATGLNGKTTFSDLSGYAFTEIHQLLVSDYAALYAEEYAIIASTVTNKAFYVYIDGIMTQEYTGDIESINYDGIQYYLLVDGVIKAYDLETDMVTDYLNVRGDTNSMILINHWLYFKDDTTGTLYQYDPATKDILVIQP